MCAYQIDIHVCHIFKSVLLISPGNNVIIIIITSLISGKLENRIQQVFVYMEQPAKLPSGFLVFQQTLIIVIVINYYILLLIIIKIAEGRVKKY